MICKISDLLLLSALSLALPLAAAGTNDALALYKDANYQAALPLLRTAIAADPKNPLLHAALLSSLTYQGAVDEAADEAQADEAAFPQSPEVITARAEFAYFMANMVTAQKLFRAAVQLNPNAARAIFGLARLFYGASYFRSARLFFLKAHDLDPDDALITEYWLGYLTVEKRGPLLGPFANAHPWLYQDYDVRSDTSKQIRSALDQRKPFTLDGDPAEANLHLVALRNGPNNFEGVGLELTINGGHKLTLEVDTGAEGILLSEAAIDKFGLNHLGTIESYGIGDEGAKKGFAALSDTCEVGPIKFKNCLIHALNGKRILKGDIEGLMGADVFAEFLIHFDFQRRIMNLKPLPPRPASPQGYDREIPADEKDFTPVFRESDHLYVTTQMNGQDTGLFLLDTGAFNSMVDSKFASLSVKLDRDETRRVRGISGEVNKVFEADKAEIQFANFRQRNIGMTAVDLNNGPMQHQDFRMSGILGLPLLALFQLTIDYRNGLVHFEQVIK